MTRNWGLNPWTLLLLLLLLLRATVTQRPESTDEHISHDKEKYEPPLARITTSKTVSTETIELTTDIGTITGLVEPTLPPHYDNIHMHAFRSIPFAKPPLGDLRFSDPVDLVGSLPGKHLSAIKAPPSCPLYDRQTRKVLGAEDCLYLNVFTPAHLDERNRADGTLLPVFVFLHGGAFKTGSSTPHGAAKVLSRDIIVVTTNYRIGALGFLSTGDSVLPGNYGMLDQVSALRWIQRNIAQFGGDPKQVTLGGFSAGSASTNFHIFSPLSKDLFHRGIMMSGASYCDRALNRDPMKGARLLAHEIGCPLNASESLKECLASKPIDQIILAQAPLSTLETLPLYFTPVIDAGLRAYPFLPAPLDELSVNPLPVITGVARDEGLYFAVQTEEAMVKLGENFYYSEEAKTDGGVMIEQLSEVAHDRHLGYCVWDSASRIAESGSTVFTYVLTHRDLGTPSFGGSVSEEVKTLGYRTSLLDTGVTHGDDIVHIFDLPLNSGNLSERDQRMGQILLHTFTDFIISGHPQKNLEKYNITDVAEWEPLLPGRPVGYYDIGVNPTMVHRPFREKEQNFWRKIILRLGSTINRRKMEILQDVNREHNSRICSVSPTSHSCVP